MIFEAKSALPRAAFIAATLLLGTPAFAAIELTPGNWQDTETGLEDGKPVPPDVTTDCMTPEEAKDPIKALTAIKDQAGECEKVEIVPNGNVVTFALKCGKPSEMLMDIQAVYTFYDLKHYGGTMKSTVTVAGKTVTAEKKVDSVWLGACKK